MNEGILRGLDLCVLFRTIPGDGPIKACSLARRAEIAAPYLFGGFPIVALTALITGIWIRRWPIRYEGDVAAILRPRIGLRWEGDSYYLRRCKCRSIGIFGCQPYRCPQTVLFETLGIDDWASVFQRNEARQEPGFWANGDFGQRREQLTLSKGVRRLFQSATAPSDGAIESQPTRYCRGSSVGPAFPPGEFSLFIPHKNPCSGQRQVGILASNSFLRREDGEFSNISEDEARRAQESDRHFVLAWRRIGCDRYIRYCIGGIYRSE